MEKSQAYDVYPLHFFDQTKSLRHAIVVSTWVYNDVLDSDRIHSALARLIDTGEWRKLGGRLRKIGDSNTMELHVPQQFTADKPAVGYSHETFDMKFHDHPLSRYIPKTDAPSTGQVSFHPGFEDFLPLTLSDNAPRTLDDHFQGDHPALTLHIVSFEDTTVVSLLWPHNLLDVLGLKGLVDAWSLMIADDASNVKPFGGARDDLLLDAANSTQARQEKYMFASSWLHGIKLITVAFSMIWDMIFYGPIEERTMCIPRKAVQGLRRELMDDLASDAVLDGGEKPFISEGDTLNSLFATSVARAQVLRRPLLLLVPFDIRSRLPNLRKDHTYVQNALMLCFVNVPAGLKSASRIAQTCRQSLVQQTKIEQVLAHMANDADIGQSGGDPANFYGPASHQLVLTSNWSKAGIFKSLNCAPAVIKAAGSKTRRNPPGEALYFTSMWVGTKLSRIRNNSRFKIFGLDHDDNFWITAKFSLKSWNYIETTLARHE